MRGTETLIGVAEVRVCIYLEHSKRTVPFCQRMEIPEGDAVFTPDDADELSGIHQLPAFEGIPSFSVSRNSCYLFGHFPHVLIRGRIASFLQKYYFFASGLNALLRSTQYSLGGRMYKPIFQDSGIS